jgi:hypothetical protein
VWRVLHSVNLIVSKATIITANLLLVCMCDKKQGKNIVAKDTGNDTPLKDFINCERIFILRKRVFSVVTPCVWVIASSCFDGTYRLHPQGFESLN